MPFVKLIFLPLPISLLPTTPPGGGRQGKDAPLSELDFPCLGQSWVWLSRKKTYIPDPPGQTNPSFLGNALATPFLLDYIQQTPHGRNDCCFTLITPLSIPSLGSVLSVKGPQGDILTWNLLFFPLVFWNIHKHLITFLTRNTAAIV